MEMEISLQPEELEVPAQMEESLLKVLTEASRLLDLAPEVEVSVLLTDDATIRMFNMEYRGKDAATDVLSFSLDEEDEAEPEVIGGPAEHLLGDIVISVETAARQAAEYGHSLEREAGFLAVHGLLHLLGYDHEKGPAEERRMRQEEERILSELGLSR